MWDEKYLSYSDDESDDDSSYSSIDNNRCKYRMYIFTVAIICILGGSGYYVATRVFDVFGSKNEIDSPSAGTSSSSLNTVSYEPEPINKIYVSVESESPPPSPCIECIVSDALNKKYRRLSLGAVFQNPKPAKESVNITNTTVSESITVDSNVTNTTSNSSLLDYLQTNGNSEIQNITSISADVVEPADYAIICPGENELQLSLDNCVAQSVTCPSRDVLPVNIYPNQYCLEVAKLNVTMLAMGFGIENSTSIETIELYESLVLSFLQLEMDTLCQYREVYGESCTNETFNIPIQKFTNVKVLIAP